MRRAYTGASVVVHNDFYEYHLPYHKGDPFFEENRIIIRRDQYWHNPLFHFLAYLTSQDRLFPVTSLLWLTESRQVPTRSFFTSHLRLFFNSSIGGQSMRAGGATSLAEHGVPPSIIQPMGRWSSTAFVRGTPLTLSLVYTLYPLFSLFTLIYHLFILYTLFEPILGSIILDYLFW